MSGPGGHGGEIGDVTRGTLTGVWFRLVRAMFLAVLWLVLRFRVEGTEHVPRRGAVLVVCNHLHNLDPVLLAAAFPRPLHFMAKIELFSVPVVRFLISRVGAFPVDRGKADRWAIRRAEAALAQGIAVGIFPEGTRSASRALKEALPGAALLALRSGVPVIPMVVIGSERLPGNGAKGRRAGGEPAPDPGHRRVRVRIGRPFEVPREADGRKVGVDEALTRLMTELARLLPPDYRGVYADTVRADGAGAGSGAEAAVGPSS